MVFVRLRVFYIRAASLSANPGAQYSRIMPLLQSSKCTQAKPLKKIIQTLIYGPLQRIERVVVFTSDGNIFSSPIPWYQSFNIHYVFYF